MVKKGNKKKKGGRSTAKPQPLPRSVKALLGYLSGTDVKLGTNSRAQVPPQQMHSQFLQPAPQMMPQQRQPQQQQQQPLMARPRGRPVGSRTVLGPSPLAALAAPPPMPVIIQQQAAAAAPVVSVAPAAEITRLRGDIAELQRSTIEHRTALQNQSVELLFRQLRGANPPSSSQYPSMHSSQAPSATPGHSVNSSRGSSATSAASVRSLSSPWQVAAHTSAIDLTQHIKSGQTAPNATARLSSASSSVSSSGFLSAKSSPTSSGTSQTSTPSLNLKFSPWQSPDVTVFPAALTAENLTALIKADRNDMRSANLGLNVQKIHANTARADLRHSSAALSVRRLSAIIDAEPTLNVELLSTPTQRPGAPPSSTLNIEHGTHLAGQYITAAAAPEVLSTKKLRGRPPKKTAAFQFEGQTGEQALGIFQQQQATAAAKPPQKKRAATPRAAVVLPANADPSTQIGILASQVAPKQSRGKSVLEMMGVGGHSSP